MVFGKPNPSTIPALPWTAAIKLYVISGVGVRNYYRKFGYKKEGFYMVKKL